MMGIVRTSRRALLLPGMLALVMAGCGGAAPEAEMQSEVDAASAGITDAPEGQADPIDSAEDGGDPGDEAADDTFDINSLPLSTAPLGDLPYFTLPEGYRESGGRNTLQLDFGELALWVGDRFQIAEGQVYATGIRVQRGSGKQYSALEVARNLEHAVTSLGGVEVFSGEIPRQVRSDDGIEAVMRAYPTESRCRDNNPVQVFGLRRDDGNVWVRTCTAQNFAGLIVLREQALEITSSVLPASEMAQQLEADGRVAIQVNFATDSADILPDSQPQLDQVLQLLAADPGLRLSIEGHTDATGDPGHNQRLSEARAQAVVAALTAQGIEASRLQAQGHGQSRPVADNDTDHGRAQNRRVELIKL